MLNMWWEIATDLSSCTQMQDGNLFNCDTQVSLLWVGRMRSLYYIFCKHCVGELFNHDQLGSTSSKTNTTVSFMGFTLTVCHQTESRQSTHVQRHCGGTQFEVKKEVNG